MIIIILHILYFSHILKVPDDYNHQNDKYFELSIGVIMCKKILKFIWNILKHIFLLPFYSSMPDKYSGIDYDKWLDKNNL